MTRASPALLFLLLVLLPLRAHAHKPSDSYLTLTVAEGRIEGRWDIALKDLEVAVGLDGDGDGVLTWGEVRARHDTIAAYALARLTLESPRGPCEAEAGEQLVDHHSDGAYTVLPFTVDCPGGAPPSDLLYRLFFDLDPTHRGLLQIRGAGGVVSEILEPGQGGKPGEARFALPTDGRGPGLWGTFEEYRREGVWHIWIGFDHILFLLALLLPAVVEHRGDRWGGVTAFRPAVGNVVAIVTAFTVAHSITLALAALRLVSLPSRWVEAAIAATVVLAAVNNLKPFLPGKGWQVAFFLGLIHGFGFAGVLIDLGLPTGALSVALAGFNLGVELGQLAIVALFLPVAYLLRDSWLYRRVLFQTGSAAVAGCALIWFVERVMG